MFSALVVEWNKENLLTFSLPAPDKNVSMFFKFFMLPLFKVLGVVINGSSCGMKRSSASMLSFSSSAGAGGAGNSLSELIISSSGIVLDVN